MYTGRQLNQGIKQVLFVIMLIALLGLIVNELDYFISSILGAFTMYMLLRKPHKKLLSKGWSNSFSALFLLILTIVIVFVLGGGLLAMIFDKVKDFRPQVIVDNLNSIHDFILMKTGYNIFSKDIVDSAVQSVSQMLPNVFSATGSIISNALMMVFVLYFMLQNSQQMESGFENNLPLKHDSINLLKKETENMVVSNAIGIPVIMIGQAVVAGLAYWLLGAGDPFVWGFMTGVFGLIPVIGTAGVWLPMAINLYIQGNTWQAIVLVIYGAVVISSVDNLIRMVFLKKYANVHPLVAIFGIILGMNLFGFWGIIFGPLMISGSILLLRIYKNEFLVDKN